MNATALLFAAVLYAETASAAAKEIWCAPTDLASARVTQVLNGRAVEWRVVDKFADGHSFIATYAKREDAERAFQIVQAYRLAQHCHLPGDTMFRFDFWLDPEGKPPAGEKISGEDCSRVGLDKLEVKYIAERKHWKVVEGDNWLLDFREDRKSAERALAIIRKFGLTQHCFVGRPHAPFDYWKADAAK